MATCTILNKVKSLTAYIGLLVGSLVRRLGACLLQDASYLRWLYDLFCGCLFNCLVGYLSSWLICCLKAWLVVVSLDW